MISFYIFKGNSKAFPQPSLLQAEQPQLSQPFLTGEMLQSPWSDSSHDWSAVMDGYTLFRKDRPARRDGGVALYVREQLERIEVFLGAHEE